MVSGEYGGQLERSRQRPDAIPGLQAARSASRSVRCRGSRLWRVFAAPGLFELVVLVLLFVAYNVVRSLPTTTATVALAHTRRLLSLEGPLLTHVDRPINHWLAATPVLAVVACYFYAALHYFMTPTILLISRHRGGWSYRRGYWVLVLASGMALIGYALFPAAPPRLVPGLGVVDVMRSYAHYGWWGSAASAPRGIGDATNQFAAFPSMHVGWALWCAIQMWGFGSRRWRVAAVLYPSVLVVVVIGTGNHFVVDVLGGAACVVVAQLVVSVVRPVWPRVRTGPRRFRLRAVSAVRPSSDGASCAPRSRRPGRSR